MTKTGDLMPTPLLSSRDALAKAMHPIVCLRRADHPTDSTWRLCENNAETLLASGAVVDVATLADNEVLVLTLRKCRGVCPSGLVRYSELTDDENTHWHRDQPVPVTLARALAAALTERAS